jgi:serine/threonine protein phosphatase PrpC
VLTVHTLTHPGSVRSTNEDAVLWEASLSLLVVADGMGGHNAGEVASRLAVDAVAAFFRKSVIDDDFTWPFGFNTRQSFDWNRLVTAVRLANRQVFHTAEERADYVGMGTTLVVATLDGPSLTYASVGDSRLYVFDGRELRQMTRDDSWIVMLREQSNLDQEALRRHPMRHVLTSVIGARVELDVPVGEVTLAAGDTILMSTDGLHEAVAHETMVAALAEAKDLGDAADRLLAAALATGGHDNISLILGRYEPGPAAEEAAT